jgi:hypothetical protein
MSCLFLVNIALFFMRSVRMTTTQSCENHEKIKRAAAGSCAQPAAAFYRSNLRNRGATGLGRGADDERAACASEPQASPPVAMGEEISSAQALAPKMRRFSFLKAAGVMDLCSCSNVVM